MAGRNEPLLKILQALVSVAQQQLPGSAVCISLIEEGRLLDVVAPDLPKTFLKTVYPRGTISQPVDTATRLSQAFPHGLTDYWTREIFSSRANRIGRVDVYFDRKTSISEVKRKTRCSKVSPI